MKTLHIALFALLGTGIGVRAADVSDLTYANNGIFVTIVDCDEDAAPTTFENSIEIQPEVNKLVIFPSQLCHEVKQTEGRRVTVSMNLNQY